MKKELLIVDGYNVIGQWPHLNELKLENKLGQARDELLRELSEYRKFTNKEIIVVFDAMYVPGLAKKSKKWNMEVIWTSKDETADSYIESLAKLKQSLLVQVVVATSDEAEQWTIFSAGALRISSRELLVDVNRVKKEIKYTTTNYNNKNKTRNNPFNEKQISELEKLRDDLL
ncbi:NYN domain-containing protein [Lactobacillus sp. S2-2]|uniref:YacP-like NYN domain-containing protein n=1 Tax=Lactobacillus sp. S2-2 TaxID=2692917 RepID=UPI001F2CBF74|nr:NYN domain-containing protein [Lactobacillus sp. S2-2]MCF6515643.1 NYN domain-containing protein [Lactobacillus sp. S2-2]